MTGTNEKCERLESILSGITFAVLEFDPSKEKINLIKNDLKILGYKISCEIEDKEQKLYHLHIKKIIGN